MNRNLFGLLMLVLIAAFSVLISSCQSRSGRKRNLEQSKEQIDTIPVIVAWSNDVRNTENIEFVSETAFQLGIKESEVTQKQLDERYETQIYKVTVTMFVGPEQFQKVIRVSTFDISNMHCDLSSTAPFNRADSISIISITNENE